jgi:phosphatidylglycerol:prolipoprotein diacylglycerol transferase
VRPVLFSLGGVDVTSYGVSKVLAALVAGWLLARELQRHRIDRSLAYPLTLAGVVGGFAGAKLYYLAEHAGSLTAMDFGGMGFTWFGGFLGGAAAVLIDARRHAIPASLIAGMAAIPLAVGYGIGRLGCLLAGDGTYGKPSDLPWAMSFPHGTVPTLERVHPTPLYEALAAFAIAALLWRLRDRLAPLALFGVYAILEGVARFLVEFLRVNDPVAFGLTQPQLWSLFLIAVGGVSYWYGERESDNRLALDPASPG